MKKHSLNIALVLMLVLAIILLIAQSHRHHNWDIDSAPTAAGGQPYDLDLLDGLLARSLPGGYTVRNLEPIDYADSDIDIFDSDVPISDLLSATPTDTSVIVVQHYDWDTRYNGEIEPLIELMLFAQRGGHAVLAYPQYKWGLNEVLDLYGINDDVHYYSQEGYNSETLYTPKWYDIHKGRCKLVSGSQTIELDHRLCYNYFDMPDCKSRFLVPSACAPGKTEHVDITPILHTEYNGGYAYGLDFYYPRTGGHLYVTSLGLAFTNLGLTAYGGVDVVSQLVGNIDHQPVIRLHYPNIKPVASHDFAHAEAALLSAVHGDETLSYVWTLLLVLAALVLCQGLMRRHPAVAGIEAEDIDHTDAMAVREYQFRKSPLLHFLFQCSWLYNGAKDYRELLDINYRCLARMVNRLAGVELTTATDTDLRKAAEILASRYGGSQQTIYEQLKWMQSFGNIPDAIVSPQQYKYSQQIIEDLKHK